MGKKLALSYVPFYKVRPYVSRHKQTFMLGPAILIRWLWPTFDMLCLIFSCRHRNYPVLLASLVALITVLVAIRSLGSAMGQHSGIWETLESPQ